MPRHSAADLSVIVPTVNEGAGIVALLDALAELRRTGGEVILADGGSTDDTTTVAASRCDRVVEAPRGRARQMNAGAAAARGSVLWFLHADSGLPADAVGQIIDALASREWGRFDVRLSGPGWPLRVVAAAMNRRSRWTGICTGDQGLFIRRAAFEALGGFPDQPLMEDVAFSARARRRIGRPACVPGPLVTSSRRWERDGVWRTILTMWRLRLAYWLGASPEALHRRYYGRPSGDDG